MIKIIIFFLEFVQARLSLVVPALRVGLSVRLVALNTSDRQCSLLAFRT